MNPWWEQFAALLGEALAKRWHGLHSRDADPTAAPSGPIDDSSSTDIPELSPKSGLTVPPHNSPKTQPET
jgi:hypothetical protein